MVASCGHWYSEAGGYRVLVAGDFHEFEECSWICCDGAGEDGVSAAWKWSESGDGGGAACS